MPAEVIKARVLKAKTNSHPREYLAWSLVKNGMFTRQERRGRNCAGNRDNKQPLDPDKLAYVRYLCFKYFPCDRPGDKKIEDNEWKKSVVNINKNLRSEEQCERKKEQKK